MADLIERPQRWKEFKNGIRRWQLPFLWIEWITKWMVYYLDRWAFVKLLNLIGSFSLVVGIWTYLADAPARARAREDERKSKVYEAWQVITSAEGKGGAGGRLEALKELNESNVALSGVVLSRAMLVGVQLPGAELSKADLREAILNNADFHGAVLIDADLQNAHLEYADLRGAILRGANLRGANLLGADLRGAYLDRSVMVDCNLDYVLLDSASVTNADLSSARIKHSSLRRTQLTKSVMRNAVITDAAWDGANLRAVDLRGATVDPVGILSHVELEFANIAGLRAGPLEMRDSVSIVAMLMERKSVSIPEDSIWTSYKDSIPRLALQIRTDGQFLLIAQLDSVYPPRHWAEDRVPISSLNTDVVSEP